MPYLFQVHTGKLCHSGTHCPGVKASALIGPPDVALVLHFVTPFLLLIRYTYLSRLSGNVNSFLDQFQNQFQGLLCEIFHNVWGGAAGDGGLKNLKKYQQADATVDDSKTACWYLKFMWRGFPLPLHRPPIVTRPLTLIVSIKVFSGNPYHLRYTLQIT